MSQAHPHFESYVTEMTKVPTYLTLAKKARIVAARQRYERKVKESAQGV